MAKHLAPILGRSAITLARALLDDGDDAEAVVRRYQPEEPARAKPSRTTKSRSGFCRSGSTMSRARLL
jgi:hypothetical protein